MCFMCSFGESKLNTDGIRQNAYINKIFLAIISSSVNGHVLSTNSVSFTLYIQKQNAKA